VCVIVQQAASDLVAEHSTAQHKASSAVAALCAYAAMHSMLLRKRGVKEAAELAKEA
jgi:hypothetical protein